MYLNNSSKYLRCRKGSHSPAVAGVRINVISKQSATKLGAFLWVTARCNLYLTKIESTQAIHVAITNSLLIIFLFFFLMNMNMRIRTWTAERMCNYLLRETLERHTPSWLPCSQSVSLTFPKRRHEQEWANFLFDDTAMATVTVSNFNAIKAPANQK